MHSGHSNNPLTCINIPTVNVKWTYEQFVMHITIVSSKHFDIITSKKTEIRAWTPVLWLYLHGAPKLKPLCPSTLTDAASTTDSLAWISLGCKNLNHTMRETRDEAKTPSYLALVTCIMTSYSTASCDCYWSRDKPECAWVTFAVKILTTLWKLKKSDGRAHAF